MTTLTQSELDDMRRKAEAAVPGVWTLRKDDLMEAGKAEIDSGIHFINGWSAFAQVVITMNGEPSKEGEANADYIVAVQPRKVLALLDHIAQLTAERDEARHKCLDANCALNKADLHDQYLNRRIAELEAQPSAQRGPEIEIDYTNYRGERAVRRIQPITIFFGASKWHPESQWLLKAFDCEKAAERCFALRDIHAWDSAQPSAQFFDIVFDGPPGHEAGRFVEVEDQSGKSIRAGEWIEPKNGETFWRLRLPMSGSAQFVAGMRRASEIAKEMRLKHSSPTGDQYTCGAWDQAARIEMQIAIGLRAILAEAALKGKDQ